METSLAVPLISILIVEGGVSPRKRIVNSRRKLLPPATGPVPAAPVSEPRASGGPLISWASLIRRPLRRTVHVPKGTLLGFDTVTVTATKPLSRANALLEAAYGFGGAVVTGGAEVGGFAVVDGGLVVGALVVGLADELAAAVAVVDGLAASVAGTWVGSGCDTVTLGTLRPIGVLSLPESPPRNSHTPEVASKHTTAAMTSGSATPWVVPSPRPRRPLVPPSAARSPCRPTPQPPPEITSTERDWMMT